MKITSWWSIYSKASETAEIDLHNMKVKEANEYLHDVISILPDNTKELKIIHGYNNGNALLKMVRIDFTDKRVLSKYLSLNQGVTIFILGGQKNDRNI